MLQAQYLAARGGVRFLSTSLILRSGPLPLPEFPPAVNVCSPGALGPSLTQIETPPEDGN